MQPGDTSTTKDTLESERARGYSTSGELGQERDLRAAREAVGGLVDFLHAVADATSPFGNDGASGGTGGGGFGMSRRDGDRGGPRANVFWGTVKMWGCVRALCCGEAHRRETASRQLAGALVEQEVGRDLLLR